MKTLKLSLIILFTAFCIQANAQSNGIDGGTVLMGGSMGFSSSTASTSANGKEVQSGSQFQFSLGPKMGYFFFRNFAAGMVIDFNTASRETVADTAFYGTAVPNQQESETQLLAGPFFRYYLFPSERVGFFGEASLGLGAGSVDAGARTQSIAQYNIGIGPGLTFFANDIVAIEALAKYNLLTQTTNLTDPAGTLYDATTKIGTVNVGVGFQFYFNRVIGAGL